MLHGWRITVPDERVNRDTEKQEFYESLTRIREQRPINHAFFEWYGAPGIGKTQLVHILWSKCQAENYPSALVDFTTFLKAGDVQANNPSSYIQATKRESLHPIMVDPIKLLEQIGRDMLGYGKLEETSLGNQLRYFYEQEHPSNIVEACLSLPNRMYYRPQWFENMRLVVARFLNLVEILGESASKWIKRPVVLFFDETEFAHDKLIDWLEEWVIDPLMSKISRNNCIIVWTGRSPHRWKRPMSRHHIRSQPLTVFGYSAAVEQMLRRTNQQDLVADFFSQVYEITQGHPGANAVAIEEINGWNKQPDNLKNEILSAVFDIFILEYVLEKLSPKERTACLLMALVRWFNPYMLEAVLKAVGDESFKTSSSEDFHHLLLRLKRTQLVVWENGYAIEGTLRPLIRNYYMTCQPDIYIRVHETALEVYKHFLDGDIDNRNLYVIEELYHTASLQLAGKPYSLKEHLQGRLKYYVQWISDPETQPAALESLKGELDNDTELNKLASELISTPLYQIVGEFLAQKELPPQENRTEGI